MATTATAQEIPCCILTSQCHGFFRSTVMKNCEFRKLFAWRPNGIWPWSPPPWVCCRCSRRILDRGDRRRRTCRSPGTWVGTSTASGSAGSRGAENYCGETMFGSSGWSGSDAGGIGWRLSQSLRRNSWLETIPAANSTRPPTITYVMLGQPLSADSSLRTADAELRSLSLARCLEPPPMMCAHCARGSTG